MFKKNDVYLRIWYILFDVLALLGMIMSWVFSVIFFVGEEIGLGVIFLLVVPVLVVISWISTHLILSVVSDIKLIRDKLYDTSSPYAKPFSFRELLFENKKEENTLIMQKRMEKTALIKLLNEGVISREEYDRRISKL